MTLTKAEQELVAIGASVGAGCHPCTEYHIAQATKNGLAQAEISKALADAECVKRSAYNELAVRGRELIGESAELPPSCCEDTSVAKEFVSLGSAVGANSIIQLRKHVDQARGVGIGLAQLNLAVEIAQNVQRHAAELTAREAELLTQVVLRGNAPIFLTGSAAASSNEESCGADCACNSREAPVAVTAGSCCSDDLEVPVVAGAKAAGKCC